MTAALRAKIAEKRQPSLARAHALLTLAAGALGTLGPVAPQIRRARRLAREALAVLTKLGPRGWPMGHAAREQHARRIAR